MRDYKDKQKNQPAEVSLLNFIVGCLTIMFMALIVHWVFGLLLESNGYKNFPYWFYVGTTFLSFTLTFGKDD